jgi:hypothetical protein
MRHASHVSCPGPEIFIKPSSQIEGWRPCLSTKHPKARVHGYHLSVSLLGSSPLSIRNLPHPIPLLRSASSGELWRVEALACPHFFPLGCFPTGGGWGATQSVAGVRVAGSMAARARSTGSMAAHVRSLGSMAAPLMAAQSVTT